MNDMWLERFKKEVLPILIEQVKPSKVLLFGSRITENATEDSDIDVIVVSERFKTIPFLNRMEMILRLTRFPKHVDYICYTPEEFSNAKESSLIIENALEACVEAIS